MNPSACILRQFKQARKSGIWGSLRTGSRAEPAIHWPGFYDLDPPEQHEVNRVWDGRRPSAVVPNTERTKLHYVHHHPCAGSNYGYTVRTIALRPPRRELQGRRWGWFLAGFAVAGLLAGGVIGGAYAGVLPLTPLQNTTGPAPAATSHRPPPEDPRPQAAVSDLEKARGELQRDTEDLRRDRVKLDAEKQQYQKDVEELRRWLGAFPRHATPKGQDSEEVAP
jgi:hypothetical protein